MQLADAERLIAEHNIEVVRVGGSDMDGAYRGKRVLAEQFLAGCREVSVFRVVFFRLPRLDWVVFLLTFLPRLRVAVLPPPGPADLLRRCSCCRAEPERLEVFFRQGRGRRRRRVGRGRCSIPLLQYPDPQDRHDQQQHGGDDIQEGLL